MNCKRHYYAMDCYCQNCGFDSREEVFENTASVRQGYVAGVAEYEGVDYLEAGVRFDRWLAEHDAEVAKAERERIVVLLNDFRERLYDDANVAADPAWDIERAEAVETCVTLIKGEN